MTNAQTHFERHAKILDPTNGDQANRADILSGPRQFDFFYD
jgi:hypothetical protein